MSKEGPATENPAETEQSAEPAAPAIDPTKTHLGADYEAGSPLISCRFDPSGRYLFAGAQNSHIVRITLADGTRTELVGHESWVRGMDFHPAGNLLYSGDFAGRLLVWPVEGESPQPQQTIEAHDGWLRGVAVSPDGSLLATCGNDQLVKLWNTADLQLVAELRGHESHIYNVAFHPDGASLVSADLKGVIRQWDVATHAETRQLDAKKLYKYDGGFRADIGGIRGINFRADGARLAATGITNVSNAFAGVGNPAVVLLDWESGKELAFLVSEGGLRATGWAVHFHPQGFLIGAAGGGAGGFLMFWKEDGPQPFHQMKLPNTVRDMHLHPDHHRLAVAHYDGHLRIYNLWEAPPKAEGS